MTRPLAITFLLLCSAALNLVGATSNTCTPCSSCTGSSLSTCSTYTFGNGVPGGSWIWFNSNLPPNAPPGHYLFVNQHISWSNGIHVASLSVPDSCVTISATGTTSNVTFANNMWYVQTSTNCNNTFVSGLPYFFDTNSAIPSSTSLTWCGTFVASGPNNAAQISWQFGSAIYNNFSSDPNALGVTSSANPVCNSQGSSVAGVPTNYIQYLSSGTGDYAGSRSGSLTSYTCTCLDASNSCTSGSVLAYEPAAGSTTFFPTSEFVYLGSTHGVVMPVSSTIDLPGGAGTNQNIDVVVFMDLAMGGPPSNLQASINSAWQSLATSFLANQLNPRFLLATLATSNSSGPFSISSDYTWTNLGANPTSSLPFPTTYSCPSATSSPTSYPLYTLVSNLMTSSAIQWSPSAFRLLWVHSACTPSDATSSAALAAASGASAVAVAFTYDNSGQLPAAYSPANMPLSIPGYSSSKTKSWGSPFASGTGMGAQLFAPLPYEMVGVAITGSQFFGNISVVPTVEAAQNGGWGSLNYTLQWPSASTWWPDPSQSPYMASLSVIGRGITTYSITFDYAPSCPNVSASFFPVYGQPVQISFSPTDADNLPLTLTVTQFPTLGSLTTLGGAAITSSSPSLPVDTWSFYFYPYNNSFGQDTILVSISDGCLSANAQANLNLKFTPSPPVAYNFVVLMQENNQAALSGGFIDFSSQFYNADNALYGQSETMTIQLLSYASPTSHGSLTATVGGTQLSPGTLSGTSCYFTLATPLSGYGNVTFNWQVTSSTSQGAYVSNTATVTVVIERTYYPPTLVIPVTQYFVTTGPGYPTSNTNISGYITSVDQGDEQNLYIVGGNMTNAGSSFQLQTDSKTYSQGQPIPFQLYSSNLTSATTIYNLLDLVWVFPSTNGTETVTLAAQNNFGLWSNNVTLTLTTVASPPPKWVTIPSNTSSSTGIFLTLANTSVTNLFFAATSTAGNLWQSLVFSLISGPSSGTLQFTNGSPVTVGASFSHSTSAVVGIDASTNTSTFSVNYIPNISFSGVVSFSFMVQDTNGLLCPTPATVFIQVVSLPTPPVGSNISISTLEQVEGSGKISKQSTNGAAYHTSLVLESVNFAGVLSLDAAQTISWTVGMATNYSTASFVTVYATGYFGTYNSLTSPNTPCGTFTYHVVEQETGLTSKTYYGFINIQHVYLAPTSQDITVTTKRLVATQVFIPVADADGTDTPFTISVQFASISATSIGNFYFDSALTQSLTSQTLSGGWLNKNATGMSYFWYIQTGSQYSQNNAPLATFTFFAETPEQGLSSPIYNGAIIVLPAGIPPQFSGSLLTTTYQETPVPMALAVGATTETGVSPIVTILTLPTRGSLAICDSTGTTCTLQDSATFIPTVVPSSTGRVVFYPRAYDWGAPFTSFIFSLTDYISGASANFTMVIDVIHVNKPPTIVAENFPLATEPNSLIVINETSWRSFDWMVWDPDSLPSVLSTSLRVTFYSAQGFSLYECTSGVDTWDSPNCTFSAAIPYAARANFTKNAAVSLTAFEWSTSTCSSYGALYQMSLNNGVPPQGQHSSGCEAHFKFAFVPNLLSSGIPFVSISFTGIDDYGAQSSIISAYIAVPELNLAPKITAPALVIGSAGVQDPVIKTISTDASGATVIDPVMVNDSDSQGNKELLTIELVEGYSGILEWPSTVTSCSADPNNASVWWCLDTITSFNSWLPELRFNVTSGARADLVFTINDLGHTTYYKPSPSLTATAYTSIRLTPIGAPPSGSSSSIAIAVGVAAAAGLLLLAAIGFFLRRKLSPPDDDYFSVAISPISASPQNPLYQQQRKEFSSALYKGKV